MKQISMALLCAAILSMIATDASAQRGGRGGFQGGGPGGPGGRGFGGPGGGFGGSSVLGLLQIDEVKEEIDLLPDQEKAIGKINEGRPRMERGERGQDVDRDAMRERFEKFREELTAFGKKADEQLEEVLDPMQMERLQQIEVQIAGIGALRIERVAKALSLSEADQKKIEETMQKGREEMMGNMREMFQSGDREGVREKMEAARKELEEKVLNELTSDQKKKFDALKGKPFEMPERQGFGGRGGRGGPGGEGFGGRGRGGRGGPGGPGGRERGEGRPESE
ncbi:hypothetical protein LOC72_00555 [Roseiconus lacunae]|nr:hypothetical protein [Roseiconus lacunae]